MQNTEIDEVNQLRGKILVEFLKEFKNDYSEVDQSKSDDGVYTSPSQFEMLIIPNTTSFNGSLRKKSNLWYNKEFCFSAENMLKLLSVVEKAGVKLSETMIELPTLGKPLRIRDFKNTFHLILTPLTSRDEEFEDVET